MMSRRSSHLSPTSKPMKKKVLMAMYRRPADGFGTWIAPIWSSARSVVLAVWSKIRHSRQASMGTSRSAIPMKSCWRSKGI